MANDQRVQHTVYRLLNDDSNDVFVWTHGGTRFQVHNTAALHRLVAQERRGGFGNISPAGLLRKLVSLQFVSHGATSHNHGDDKCEIHEFSREGFYQGLYRSVQDATEGSAVSSPNREPTPEPLTSPVRSRSNQRDEDTDSFGTILISLDGECGEHVGGITDLLSETSLRNLEQVLDGFDSDSNLSGDLVDPASCQAHGSTSERRDHDQAIHHERQRLSAVPKASESVDCQRTSSSSTVSLECGLSRCETMDEGEMIHEDSDDPFGLADEIRTTIIDRPDAPSIIIDHTQDSSCEISSPSDDWACGPVKRKCGDPEQQQEEEGGTTRDAQKEHSAKMTVRGPMPEERAMISLPDDLFDLLQPSIGVIELATSLSGISIDDSAVSDLGATSNDTASASLRVQTQTTA